MIISNKDNPLGSISLSYAEWLRDYIKTGRYKAYVVDSPKGVVELHKADEKTHRFKFNMLIDEHIGRTYAAREPIRFKIEPLSGKYSNEHLIFSTQSKNRSFKERKIRHTAKPIIKKAKSFIISFFRFISNNRLVVRIILLVLGTLLSLERVRSYIENLFPF